LSQAIGHRLAAPMRAGEPLVGQRLVGADLTRGLGPTLVAMSVPAADDRIGDFVDPGDRVDLYPAPDAEAEGKPVASAPVAEGVLVLAVLPASAGDSGAEQLGADGGVTKLVLAVQRADAGRLASANSSQKFTVVLDPP
jgi:Flp pilus assembly protein CpaB